MDFWCVKAGGVENIYKTYSVEERPYKHNLCDVRYQETHHRCNDRCGHDVLQISFVLVLTMGPRSEGCGRKEEEEYLDIFCERIHIV